MVPNALPFCNAARFGRELPEEAGSLNICNRRWIQLVDATVRLNISAGVWKPRVFLGPSFNLLATALTMACE
jgi:hypothetical protein